MTSETFYEATGVNFRLTPISFRKFPGATTMIGGVAFADMYDVPSKVKYAGTAVINVKDGVEGIDCDFPDWAALSGTFSVQVRAAPVGYELDTIKEFTCIIKKSAAVAP